MIDLLTNEKHKNTINCIWNKNININRKYAISRAKKVILKYYYKIYWKCNAKTSLKKPAKISLELEISLSQDKICKFKEISSLLTGI